jgi:tetratricopeptide (TPR) repeat protein
MKILRIICLIFLPINLAHPQISADMQKAADQGDVNAPITNAPTTSAPVATTNDATITTNAPSSAAPQPPTIGQNVSVTLADGTVKAGKLTKIDSDGIELLTDDGGGEIPFTALSKSDQVNYGYDATTFESSGDEKSGKGDWDGAISDYTKAIELDPQDAVAYRDRGDAKAKKEDWDGAIADYSVTVSLDPKDDLAYSDSGDAKAKKEDWDGAIADYSKAIEIDPKDAFYYSSRGDAEDKKGDSDGTILDYTKAIELKPDADYFYVFRGVAKIEKGDYGGASEDFTQAIKLSPNNNEAYDNRGVAKEGLTDLDGAIADYSKAIELDPNDDFAYSHRAKAKIEKGDANGAGADFAKANQITAQSAPSRASSESEPQSDSAGGLSAGAVQVRATEQDDEYVHFGWKVPVTNVTNHDATDVSVEISCRDSSDIEIDSFVSNANAIPQGKTINVTASTLMKKALWQQADHWTARISDYSR